MTTKDDSVDNPETELAKRLAKNVTTRNTRDKKVTSTTPLVEQIFEALTTRNVMPPKPVWKILLTRYHGVNIKWMPYQKSPLGYGATMTIRNARLLLGYMINNRVCVMSLKSLTRPQLRRMRPYLYNELLGNWMQWKPWGEDR
jgi:hypothetical protein